jgi:hypothetical protein
MLIACSVSLEGRPRVSVKISGSGGGGAGCPGATAGAGAGVGKFTIWVIGQFPCLSQQRSPKKVFEKVRARERSAE